MILWCLRRSSRASPALIIMVACRFCHYRRDCRSFDFGQTVNMMSLIGLTMLLGSLPKRRFFCRLCQPGKSGRKECADAILEACSLRLRPILMTSLSTCSASPIALGIAGRGTARLWGCAGRRCYFDNFDACSRSSRLPVGRGMEGKHKPAED